MKLKFSKILTKKFLYQEYVANQKSTPQIAKEVGCSHPTVLKYLKIYKIKRRKHKGKNHNWYINGCSSKQYYCKDCLKKGIKAKICRDTALYRGGRCSKCATIYTGKDKQLQLKRKRIFKKLWQGEEFRNESIKRMTKGRKLSPNKPEKLLTKLLNKLLSKTYKFVGNGKLIIGGFVPDFVNKGNTKIIEMFGNYWHTKKGAKQKDKRRLIAYKKYGYKTLIIWEKELKDLDRVKARILKFNKIL